MAKQRKEIYTHAEIIDAIESYGDIDACSHSSDFFDADGSLIASQRKKFFVVAWPEHAITRQHIGDATIHGPYDSKEEAEEIHG